MQVWLKMEELPERQPKRSVNLIIFSEQEKVSQLLQWLLFFVISDINANLQKFYSRVQLFRLLSWKGLRAWKRSILRTNFSFFANSKNRDTPNPLQIPKILLVPP